MSKCDFAAIADKPILLLTKESPRVNTLKRETVFRLHLNSLRSFIPSPLLLISIIIHLVKIIFSLRAA